MRQLPFAGSGLIVSAGERMIGYTYSMQHTYTLSRWCVGVHGLRTVLGRLMSPSSLGAQWPDVLLCLLAWVLAPVSRYKQHPSHYDTKLTCCKTQQLPHLYTTGSCGLFVSVKSLGPKNVTLNTKLLELNTRFSSFGFKVKLPQHTFNLVLSGRISRREVGMGWATTD